MTAPYDRKASLTLGGVTVSPWRMSSLGTWTATAIDRREGVVSWLVVRRSIVRHRELPAIMMWLWEARQVGAEFDAESMHSGGIVFEATPNAIDEALIDAMTAAENVALSRYDISASFGWQRPEMASA